MHAILHDWPDDKSVEILKNLAAAAEKDYSSILLHEAVLTDHSQNLLANASDLTMMAFFSSGERSAGKFEELAGAAGLKVKKVWTSPMSYEGIVECEVA